MERTKLLHVPSTVVTFCNVFEYHRTKAARSDTIGIATPCWSHLLTFFECLASVRHLASGSLRCRGKTCSRCVFRFQVATRVTQHSSSTVNSDVHTWWYRWCSIGLCCCLSKRAWAVQWNRPIPSVVWDLDQSPSSLACKAYVRSFN